MSDLEFILEIGAAVVVGTIATAHIILPVVGFVDRWNARKYQRDFAKELNLKEIYQLSGITDLALSRVGILDAITEDITKRTNYEEEEIFPTLESYVPQIAEQSNFFATDIKETNAYNQFLSDERTKKWLTDQAYVMSDREYYLRTNPLGLLISFYYSAGRAVSKLVKKKELTYKEKAVESIVSPFLDI